MGLTASELVVLGLVLEQPRHGYDLDRVIAERGIRQWAPLAFSSIYYVLGKLEERGLLVAESGAGSRSRRIYRATEVGKAAAREATTAMLLDVTPSFSPFVVGLANVELIGLDQFSARLSERARALGAQIAAVEAARDASGALPPAARLVFSYTLAALVAEHHWLREEMRPHEDRPQEAD